jgi:hypothetical protein
VSLEPHHFLATLIKPLQIKGMQGGGSGTGVNLSLNGLDAKLWQPNPLSPTNDVVGFSHHHIA